jgi:hypothetical protein
MHWPRDQGLATRMQDDSNTLKRVVRDINNIAAWLWEDRAPVTADEQ